MFNSSHLGRAAYTAFIVAGVSACGPAEEEGLIQESENLTASAFVKNGFNLLGKANTLVAGGTNAGFIADTILGRPNYAQISPQVIEQIADAVGQRVDQSLFRRDSITAETVLEKEADYIRPDCVRNDSCDQFTVTDMRNDARSLDRDSRRILDQLVGAPNFLPLQAAQHIQRLSMTRIFSTHEIGLASLQREGATGNDNINHQANLEQEGNLAVQRLNDLEDLLIDFVDQDYSDIDIFELNNFGPRQARACFDNPGGRFCTGFSERDLQRNESVRSVARAEASRERRWQIYYNLNQLRDITLSTDFDEARDRMAAYGDGSVTPQAPYSYSSCGRLEGNRTMRAGQRLNSCNGQFQLVMQGDGNLVIYERGTARWASRTRGRGGDRVSFQGDGNLVIYRPGSSAASNAVWATRTHTRNADRRAVSMLLRDDGSLVLRDRYGRQVWRNN